MAGIPETGSEPQHGRPTSEPDFRSLENSRTLPNPLLWSPEQSSNSNAQTTTSRPIASEGVGDSAHTSNGNTLDDYQCPICMDLLMDPAATNCGHRFCTFCLANWFEQRGRKNCPTCRAAINEIHALPEIAEKVERLADIEYTTAQKAEREETQRVRVNSPIMQRLGSSPLQTLMSRRLHDNHFEFDLPIFDFDDEFADEVTFTQNLSPTNTPHRVINLTATTIYNGDPSSNSWLPFFEGALAENSSASVQNPDNRYLEVESLLDDFEIRLRQAQLAFRSLMDSLTNLDPNGVYFRRIEDRFRSLGLSAEDGRLVTTFPSQEIESSRLPSSFLRNNGASERNSRHSDDPHPSDWYFINRNRSLPGTNIFELARREWSNYYRNHHRNLNTEEMYRQSNWQEERPVRDRDPANVFQGDSIPQRERDTTLPGLDGSLERRRSYHDPNDFINESVPEDFPTLDRHFEFYDATRDHTFEYHRERNGDEFTQQHPQARNFGNHIVTNAHSVCVLHSDGTETWVELEESENNSNAREFQQAREMFGESERIMGSLEAVYLEGENQRGLQQGDAIEFVLEHS